LAGLASRTSDCTGRSGEQEAAAVITAAAIAAGRGGQRIQQRSRQLARSGRCVYGARCAAACSCRWRAWVAN
jgi:hypothetical protein